MQESASAKATGTPEIRADHWMEAINCIIPIVRKMKDCDYVLVKRSKAGFVVTPFYFTAVERGEDTR